MLPAYMAVLSFAVLVLLMQFHQLATQEICGCHLTACDIEFASQGHVNCTAMRWVSLCMMFWLLLQVKRFAFNSNAALGQNTALGVVWLPGNPVGQYCSR